MTFRKSVPKSSVSRSSSFMIAVDEGLSLILLYFNIEPSMKHFCS